jgi:hypothetical protein
MICVELSLALHSATATHTEARDEHTADDVLVLHVGHGPFVAQAPIELARAATSHSGQQSNRRSHLSVASVTPAPG